MLSTVCIKIRSRKRSDEPMLLCKNVPKSSINSLNQFNDGSSKILFAKDFKNANDNIMDYFEEDKDSKISNNINHPPIPPPQNQINGIKTDYTNGYGNGVAGYKPVKPLTTISHMNSDQFLKPNDITSHYKPTEQSINSNSNTVQSNKINGNLADTQNMNSQSQQQFGSNKATPSFPILSAGYQALTDSNSIINDERSMYLKTNSPHDSVRLPNENNLNGNYNDAQNDNDFVAAMPPDDISSNLEKPIQALKLVNSRVFKFNQNMPSSNFNYIPSMNGNMNDDDDLYNSARNFDEETNLPSINYGKFFNEAGNQNVKARNWFANLQGNFQVHATKPNLDRYYNSYIPNYNNYNNFGSGIGGGFGHHKYGFNKYGGNSGYRSGDFLPEEKGNFKNVLSYLNGERPLNSYNSYIPVKHEHYHLDGYNYIKPSVQSIPNLSINKQKPLHGYAPYGYNIENIEHIENIGDVSTKPCSQNVLVSCEPIVTSTYLSGCNGNEATYHGNSIQKGLHDKSMGGNIHKQQQHHQQEIKQYNIQHSNLDNKLNGQQQQQEHHDQYNQKQHNGYYYVKHGNEVHRQEQQDNEHLYNKHYQQQHNEYHKQQQEKQQNNGIYTQVHQSGIQNGQQNSHNHQNVMKTIEKVYVTKKINGDETVSKINPGSSISTISSISNVETSEKRPISKQKTYITTHTTQTTRKSSSSSGNSNGKTNQKNSVSSVMMRPDIATSSSTISQTLAIPNFNTTPFQNRYSSSYSAINDAIQSEKNNDLKDNEDDEKDEEDEKGEDDENVKDKESSDRKTRVAKSDEYLFSNTESSTEIFPNKITDNADNDKNSSIDYDNDDVITPEEERIIYEMLKKKFE
ncbi:putative uncharacterized protein DDB_G0282499 [Condylostylus longicornis]|uniref:putative uncharacterized protein DDB_G0282499 n=1 Tax=Condylostylus longicornis TaxID=2530218 RepID=UPI00244E1F3A|nr:putative uncharacterized protein DDB_G0282499 [Condylostylus longicornis]